MRKMEKFMCETKETTLLKKVYEHLQDEESKKIYCARSLFSLSDDRAYMKEVVRNMVVSVHMCQQLYKNKDKKLVLFGAGEWGKALMYYFPEIEWSCIVDNNRVGEKMNGYEIISLEKMLEMENVYVIVAVLFKYKEIEKQLRKVGLCDTDFLMLGKVAVEKTYFDLPMIHFSDDEVYVDIGAFNGDTAMQFANMMKNRYEHIYMLEPNKLLYEECKNKFSELENCTIINKGAWDKTDKLSFVEAGEGSRIVNESDAATEIETVSLDECLEGKKVTYIKMDVEGAEMAALIGAENLIRTNKPKLAISVYHKRDDIWEIPKLLLKYNPDYKFYLRIYSFTGNDTVLYAL